MSAGSLLLVRRPSLELETTADGAISVRLAGGRVDAGRHGLAILDAFGEARTLGDALEVLGERCPGQQDWMDLVAAVLRLREAGVLVPPEDADRPLGEATDTGFASAKVHIAMLDDEQRTAAYLEAIRAAVGPDDVVVDIGTGTGILAATAAAAGARAVYAVEARAEERWAEGVFAANGVADRARLVHGWSTAIDLPERADVLVTETIGNEPLEESILEIAIDARARLLRPGARFIPAGIELWASAVELPDRDIRHHRFTAGDTERWSADYGLDLRSLAEDGSGPAYAALAAGVTRRWRPLTEPVLLTEIDLATVSQPMVDVASTVEAATSGSLNAVAVHFRLLLHDDIALSSLPADIADPDRFHWGIPVWLLPSALRVDPGDEVRLRYRYRVPGVDRHQMVTVGRA